MALVDDLMDRSRITAAVGDVGVTFARGPSGCGDADVVVIDVERHSGAIAAARAAAPEAWIVAYGPHVDDERLAAAAAAGADVAVPRSRFFHDPASALRRRA